MSNEESFGTEAWLLRGISSVPGDLRLESGNLTFTAFGSGNLWKFQLRKLERDTCQPGLANNMLAEKNVIIFDAPLTAVEIVFPWYTFSGGLNVRVGNARFRLGFDRPANTQIPVEREASVKGSIEAGKRVVESVQEIRKARQSGKAWKSVIERLSASKV